MQFRDHSMGFPSKHEQSSFSLCLATKKTPTSRHLLLMWPIIGDWAYSLG